MQKTCLKRSYKATNAGAELPPVCTSIYIHFLFRNWFFDSRRVRKNKCNFLGHGWLVRNGPEIAWAGQKCYQIHISLTNGRRNLADHSKWPQDLIQREYASKLYPCNNQKCPKNAFFWYLGTLYGKILTFSVFKKPFKIWNQLAPQNNSTVQFSGSVLQPWKHLQPTIVVKKLHFIIFQLNRW